MCIRDRAQGKLRESDVQRGLAEQKKHAGLIGQCFVALGLCTQGDVAQALAEQSGLESVDLASVQPTDDALALVDASIAHTFRVLPILVRDGRLLVALADPLNVTVLEDIAFAAGMPTDGAMADPELLTQRVRELYGEEESLSDCLLYTSPSPRDKTVSRMPSSA